VANFASVRVKTCVKIENYLVFKFMCVLTLKTQQWYEPNGTLAI